MIQIPTAILPARRSSAASYTLDAPPSKQPVTQEFWSSPPRLLPTMPGLRSQLQASASYWIASPVDMQNSQIINSRSYVVSTISDMPNYHFKWHKIHKYALTLNHIFSIHIGNHACSIRVPHLCGGEQRLPLEPSCTSYGDNTPSGMKHTQSCASTSSAAHMHQCTGNFAITLNHKLSHSHFHTGNPTHGFSFPRGTCFPGRL